MDYEGIPVEFGSEGGNNAAGAGHGGVTSEFSKDILPKNKVPVQEKWKNFEKKLAAWFFEDVRGSGVM